MDHPLQWYQIALLVLQCLISLAFVVIVMSQTTKNEGLTGTIGNNMQANFKGKPGREEQIQALTLQLGVAWGVVSILVGIAFRGT